MHKNILIICIIIVAGICSSWGFYAHKKINETAIYLLPAELASLFKQHIRWISEKAIDADKRCYVDSLESPKHYIDLNEYSEVDTLPIHWSRAKEKINERKLLARGIVPWQIARTYLQLVDAFKHKEISKIIRYSADLGHYVADAHVPLHTTSNYNGQYSNQIGIHALWETRLPEKFAKDYDFHIGPITYIEDVPLQAWQIVRESHLLVDSVLSLEKQLAQSFKNKEIRAYITRNNQLIWNYSDEYARAYHQALKGMVERRMRASIYYTASLWYSAWIDAGQPKLRSIKQSLPIQTDTIPSFMTSPIGRIEWH